MKRTIMIIEFQPPCYVQGCQPLDQAAQSHIQPGLECLQGWGIHSLLGWAVPVCHHLCVKNFLLISNLNLPCLSLKPFPLVLSLSNLVNSHSPSYLYAPFKYWKATMRSPWSLLQAKQSQFPQPFLIWEVLQPSSGPTPSVQCLSCTGGPRPGCSTPDEASEEPSRGGQSPPSPCWPLLFYCSPG